MTTLRSLFRTSAAIALLAVGMSAQAAEVGDRIAIDASQLTCTDSTITKPNPKKPCAYCYGYGYGYGYDWDTIRLTLDLPLDGVTQFSSVSYMFGTCAQLKEALAKAGPLTVEVTRKAIEKVNDNLTTVNIRLQLSTGIVVFNGSGTL